jgi:hypothetical protein
MIVAIHQPEHLPWLGFLHKASLSDCFVILDNVQFRKNYFQNRNRIRTVSGASWVTVPVRKHKLSTPINQIEITSIHRWTEKYWKTIDINYSKAPEFKKHRSFFKSLLQSDWDNLLDINMEIIRYLFEMFGINPQIILASSLANARGISGKLLLSLCKEIGATEYLSGISGKEYLDETIFHVENIKVMYQEFYHPIYQQVYEPFKPCMSSIDMLFNCGDKAGQLLKSTDTPRMDALFY